ncbi:MAG: 23S rRNA (guanosine(2251)-2'-O)-methyltransferase RlmB [Bdellovibrionota bacterium]
MGYHAVEAVLGKGYPVKSIHCLQRNDNSRAGNLKSLAGKAKAAWREYSQKDKARFEAEFKRAGGTPAELEASQGVFAEVPDPQPVSHLDALRAAKEKEPYPVVLYLDSITDPQNLGSILRSSAFFGVAALVLTETRSSPLTPAAIKISSGGFAHVPLVRVPNLARALDEAKEEGFWVIGLSEHATEKFHTARLDSPLALIIGNEESGMRQLTEKSCDYTLSIPGSGPLVSLNAATAAAVTLALVRETQRKIKS